MSPQSFLLLTEKKKVGNQKAKENPMELMAYNSICKFKPACYIQEKHCFMLGKYSTLSFICKQVMCSVDHPC